MDIRPITSEEPLWFLTMDYANQCSWSAGPILAQLMQERAFTDWERIFVATEGGDIAGYCTLAKEDCIPNVAYTPFIGFVFVDEDYRGQHLSGQLINCALRYAKSLGFVRVYLVSAEKGLYEKYGFVKLEDARDPLGREEQIFSINI